jgi:hypothetical protein
MKRTKWYNGYQKPVRVGYYERDYWLNFGEESTVMQSYWDATSGRRNDTRTSRSDSGKGSR